MNQPIPQIRILQMIERLMNFPCPQICRHLVASDLLSLLEEHGMQVSSELASAVVGANDEEAIKLIREKYEPQPTA